MQKNQLSLLTATLLLAALCTACNGRIDRRALVSRNNPHVDALAPLNSLNLGNGAFTLTLDATGLQTFPEYCKDGLSLGTFSEWGWHAFPNVEGYTQAESLEDHPLPGHPHASSASSTTSSSQSRALEAASAFSRRIVTASCAAEAGTASTMRRVSFGASRSCVRSAPGSSTSAASSGCAP